MIETVKIACAPIGVVCSPFRQAAGTPIQSSQAAGAFGTVVLEQRYADGLADLAGFSHIILLSYLHRAKPYSLQVVPYLDTVPRGLFATRAPSRPNPIGLSVVKLLGIAGHVLTVAGLDLLDGTPLLDIKPYFGNFDRREDVRCGWLDAVREREVVADNRFATANSEENYASK